MSQLAADVLRLLPQLPDWVGPDPGTRFFDRDKCLNWTASLIQNGTVSVARDAWLFATDAFGQTIHGTENMTLSLDGCNRLCGPKTFYVDAGPRFMTWILPIVLLLSNIELSPIDKWRFTTLFQVLGDPVDAIWSLIHKMQTWNRIYEIATRYVEKHLPPPKDKILWARIVATVLVGFEDIVGREINDDGYFKTILTELGPIGHPDREQYWQQAAFELSDGRTDEFLRTILAILLYILQVTSAFEPDMGGEPPTPPGGVIACALFLSFLLPVAILSNCLGAFTSRRSCLAIMTRLVAATAPQSPRYNCNLIERTSWSNYFNQLQYRGNYTYRPWKSSGWVYTQPYSVPLTTALWAALPICVSFAGAFPIMTFAVPYGFSCRHVWLVIVFGLWILSVFISIA
ncbi:hypothetical protein BGZ57DRAFT_755181, partial [Hyaloscypha finlandica]